uniref:RING-type E3 ubiquitin transferase n=1 Tax=Timema shepardi TaxID=629360 RepID=A0A7R9AMC1_TIMSH|nr:unnamed protein product [Timema shepardi]
MGCLARLAAMQSHGEGRPTLRLCEVMRGSDGACGFHLSRTQWDPYPWVSGVEGGSAADASGLVAGDCVLEVNGEDVLGQRIGQVADKVRARTGTLSLLLWNPGSDPHATTAISAKPGIELEIPGRHSVNRPRLEKLLICPHEVELTPFKTHCFTDNMNSLEIKPGTTGSVAKNSDHSLSLEKRKRRDGNTRRAGVLCGSTTTPVSLQRLASCLQSVLQLLECPVCLETIPPPAFQCCNGHALCAPCRSRADKCPVCRVPLGPRGRCLLADKLHNLLTAAFQPRATDTTGGRQANKHPQQQFPQLIQLKARLLRQPKASSDENLSANTDIRRAPRIGVSSLIRTRSLSTGMIPAANSFPPCKEPAKPHEDTPIHCPYGPSCPDSFPSARLPTHLREFHRGPLVQYFPRATSPVRVRFPFSQVELVSLVAEDGATFFLRDAKVPEGRLVWLWVLADEASARELRMRVTSPGGDAREGPVFPLSVSWEDVIRSRQGLVIDEGSYHGHAEIKVEVVHLDRGMKDKPN